MGAWLERRRVKQAEGIRVPGEPLRKPRVPLVSIGPSSVASLQDPDEALRQQDLVDLYMAVKLHPRDPGLSEDDQIASLLSSISDKDYWARIVSRSAESHSTSAELLRDFMQDMEDEEGGQTPL